MNDESEAWLRELLDEELDREYQVELLKLQEHVMAQGLRLAVLFRGAGHGGQGRRDPSLLTAPAPQAPSHRRAVQAHRREQRWESLTRYKQAMFARTSTDDSPWIVVRGNRKKNARLESIRHVLASVAYEGKGQPELRLEPSPEVVARPRADEGSEW